VDLDAEHQNIPLHCSVAEFQFSAHSNRETLRNYAMLLRPKTILLVHGEKSATDWFQLALFKELVGTEVFVPEPGRKYKLA
jgi:Cft2 family RNA processing exonuclease